MACYNESPHLDADEAIASIQSYCAKYVVSDSVYHHSPHPFSQPQNVYNQPLYCLI